MTERNSAAPVGFGPHIRALREAADMKQKDVAARVGVSQAHLSSMEAKAHLGYLPAPEIVSGLAKVFGVSEASLLRHAGYLTDDAQDVSAPLAGDAQIAELERIAREMGPDRIRAKREAIIESIIAALDDESAGHGTGS